MTFFKAYNLTNNWQEGWMTIKDGPHIHKKQGKTWTELKDKLHSFIQDLNKADELAARKVNPKVTVKEVEDKGEPEYRPIN